MKIDHLAVAVKDLAVGVQWVETLLGVRTAPGGRHDYYGTHNRLLSLGPDLYLEIISPDPNGAKPSHRRWFGLDSAPISPRLANWIVQSDNLDILDGVGPPVALSRGDLTWELTVPPDGNLPRGGAIPTLIRWGPGGHPAERLPDHGLRLSALEVHHPDAEALGTKVLPALADPRVTYHAAPETRLRAKIDTAKGPVWLE